ncbi:MAG: hypothetical protein LUI09_00080 [Prevotellaceae bacterium]|nr:hypothetical protein [Prevotellaceae bacterium]
MPINYSLIVRRTRPGSGASSKKVCARAQASGACSLERMQELVAKRCHSCDKFTVRAVLDTVAECLLRELLDGKRVYLGDLGTFYSEITGSASDNPDDCRPDKGGAKLVFKWRPSQSLRKAACGAEYKYVGSRASQEAARQQSNQELREEMERRKQKRE